MVRQQPVSYAEKLGLPGAMSISGGMQELWSQTFQLVIVELTQPELIVCMSEESENHGPKDPFKIIFFLITIPS